MPFSSIINIAYLLLGVYWPQRNASTTRCPIELQRAHYLKDVFASMVLIYGPVQRLWVWTQMYLTVMLAPHFAHFHMANGVVLFPIQRLDALVVALF